MNRMRLRFRLLTRSHLNALNSVRVITGTAGLRAKRTIYLPFGETMDYNVDPVVAAETKGFVPLSGFRPCQNPAVSAGERFDAAAAVCVVDPDGAV